MNLKDKRDTIDMLYGSPLSAISSCLRGFMIPKPGYDFLGADFSSIEARVLAWLAGEERVLNIFRGDGKLYEHTASELFNCSIDEIMADQRQMGKVAELALGFGGGKGAFQVMAESHGVRVTPKRAEEIKLKWRANRPKIVRFWSLLENSAANAISQKGRTFHCQGGIKFKTDGSFLWCMLPSKRVLCYPYPKIELVDTPWGQPKMGITYMGVSSMTNKWEKQKTYGGSLSENVTQAVARDVLVQAMLRLERNNFPIVLHVHDEIVCEVRKDLYSVKYMEDIMTQTPHWAKGLPIAAHGWRGNRYQK